MAKAVAKAVEKKDTVWVLTYEINQYDQDGEYFMAVFKSKPDHQKLATTLSMGQQGCYPNGDVMAAIAFLEHLLKGGGRQAYEDTWYHLREVEAV